MSAHRDPDLDGIGDELGWNPEVRELAQYLRATPHTYEHIEPSPQFRQDLRRRLMREAWERASRPAAPWYRRLLAPQPMAMAGAAVGALLIVTVALLYSLGPHQADRVELTVMSPQNNAQLVSTVKPIELQFSQTMKSADVNVVPATEKTTQWDAQRKILYVTPVNGLTGNTQYQVTVTSATTADGKQVSKIKPVMFSTGPAPTPTPSVSPRPSTPPSPILSPHAVAPIAGGTRAHWTPDGTGLVVIGPNGQLQQITLAGGTVRQLASGATLDAVAPDGSVAWVGNGQVTWKSTVINAQPIALGFRSGGLLLASVADVERADQTRVAAFKDTADAADFSPAGDRVVYHAVSGLHVVDLASGRDTLVGPAAGLGAWAPDARHFAYVTDTGVSIADANGGATAKLVDLAGVTGVSWSRGQQLLVSTASALYLVNYPTSGQAATPQKLSTPQDGAFGSPDWAPDGSGQFTFHRASEVWVARVQGAVAGTPITPVTPGVTQDDLVNSFLAARKDQLADQAASFLDAAGQAAFSRYSLIDPTLARYYVLLSQPGRVVVRLVLVHGAVQAAIDETLGIQPDASNHLYIHSVTQVPRSPFATGPEVVGIVVSGGQVQVTFDSDLDPNSAVQPAAVGIKGVTTQAKYDSKTKTVTLTVPSGLTAGTTYDLLIGSSLQDVNGRSAVAYDLQFTGPATS